MTTCAENLDNLETSENLTAGGEMSGQNLVGEDCC